MTATARNEGSKLSKGDYAPDFTLDTDTHGTFTLSEHRGKNIVLYFYPKDDTPGCTIEANDFTRLKDEFDAVDALVLGLSKDSVKSHEKFREKHCLSIPLAADEHGTVCEAYDCWVEKNMYGKKYMGIQRDTFLIDAKGVIQQVWRKVKVDGHAQDVLDAARSL